MKMTLVKSEIVPINARYRVSQYGYIVEVYSDNGDLLESYTAGNNPLESSSIIDPRSELSLSLATLHEYAKSTAKEMIDEHNLKGSIVYDLSLSLLTDEDYQNE